MDRLDASYRITRVHNQVDRDVIDNDLKRDSRGREGSVSTSTYNIVCAPSYRSLPPFAETQGPSVP
jgi:hypothetical protein